MFSVCVDIIVCMHIASFYLCPVLLTCMFLTLICVILTLQFIKHKKTKEKKSNSQPQRHSESRSFTGKVRGFLIVCAHFFKYVYQGWKKTVCTYVQYIKCCSLVHQYLIQMQWQYRLAIYSAKFLYGILLSSVWFIPASDIQ